jgi:hypothetical protein
MATAANHIDRSQQAFCRVKPRVRHILPALRSYPGSTNRQQAAHLHPVGDFETRQVPIHDRTATRPHQTPGIVDFPSVSAISSVGRKPDELMR